MASPQEDKGLRVMLEKNIRQLVLFILAIAAIESIVFLSRIHRARITFSMDVSGSASLNESGKDAEKAVKSTLKHLINDSVQLKSSTVSSRKSSVFLTTVSPQTPPPLTNSSSSANVVKNARCLQRLLDLNIVEYYYYPENDADDNLNFTVKGRVSKTRLPNRKDRPSIVLCSQPTFDRKVEKLALKNESFTKNSCRSDIFDFLPNMMARDFDLLRNLVKFFKHVAALSGMEYYLNYGSLLGHVRFNGRPIPWDDDLDFSVDYTVLKKFRRIFKRERSIYFGNKTKNGHFYPDLHVGKIWAKVFDASQSKIGGYAWTYPFIDLFFYRLFNEDFYDLSVKELESFPLTDGVNSASAYNLSIDIIMPFKKEIFLGIKLPVPANATEVLKRSYGYSTSTCRPLGWYHRFERSKKYPSSSVIKCSLLEGIYDFSDDL